MNLSHSARWWALGATTLSVLAVSLDLTVLSIALPTLAHALHASESQLQWFTSSYALAVTTAILPAGLLGDRYGRKKGLLLALGLFGLGSIFCAYSPSPETFIVARTLLGLAGAAVITLVLSVLPVLFSEAERPRAVGIWGAANFVALPIGPILGGWMLSHYWWGWVFLMNVPVALIGMMAILVLLPESRSPNRPGVDLLGIATSSAGLAAITYGIIQVGQSGWTDARALLSLGLGLVVLALFVAWQRRLDSRGGQPLVDLALFRSRAFTSGVVLMTIVTISMAAVLFISPQYFQGVLGLDAQGSGVRLLPLIAGLILGAVPADRLVGRIGAKVTVAAGLAVLAAGMLMASVTGVSSSTVFIAAWMAIIGIGTGLALATSASAALMELSSENSGVGSALMQAVKNLGLPFGTAILGSVLNNMYRSRLNVTGLPGPAAKAAQQSVFGGAEVAHTIGSGSFLQAVHGAFTHGMDASFWVAAGFSLAGALLAWAWVPRRINKSGTING